MAALPASGLILRVVTRGQDNLIPYLESRYDAIWIENPHLPGGYLYRNLCSVKLSLDQESNRGLQSAKISHQCL